MGVEAKPRDLGALHAPLSGEGAHDVGKEAVQDVAHCQHAVRVGVKEQTHLVGRGDAGMLPGVQEWCQCGGSRWNRRLMGGSKRCSRSGLPDASCPRSAAACCICKRTARLDARGQLEVREHVPPTQCTLSARLRTPLAAPPYFLEANPQTLGS